MSTIAGIEGAARRHRPIRRIIIITVLLLMLVEPLFMYRMLVRERARRRVVAESSLVDSGTAAAQAREAGQRTD